jgi:tetratricopeptide (TPR) repeat protein
MDRRRTHVKTPSLVAAALWLGAGCGHAGTGRDAATVAALTPLEQVLFDDLSDGRLDSFDLLQAGLVASGVGSLEGLNRALAEARPLLDAVDEAASKADPRDPVARARALFDALFAQLFRRYDLRQSRIDVLLTSGVYNCVSSALLFNALARRLGLETAAVDAVTHTYSVVWAKDRRIEVETTDPGGFEPIRDEASYQRFLRERELWAGRSRLEGKELVEIDRALALRKANERQVPDLALVSFVYSNRGAVAAEEGRHAEAAAALAKASRLFPADERHAASRDALLHNLALSHIRAGRWRDALALLELALAQTGAPGDLFDMIAECHLQLAWQAAGETDAEATSRHLLAALEAAPADARVAHNRAVIAQHLATRLGVSAAGVAAARRFLLAHLGSGAERQALWETLVALTSNRARDLGRADDWRGAERLVQETLAEARPAGLGGGPEGALYAAMGLARFKLGRYLEAAQDFALARARGYDPDATVTKNQAAALLNLAIDAFNKKNCPEALRRVADAEALEPTDPVLLKIRTHCASTPP